MNATATGVIGWAMQDITCPMCRDRGERVMLRGLSIAQADQVYDVGTIGRVVDGHQHYERDYLCGASLRAPEPLRRDVDRWGGLQPQCDSNHPGTPHAKRRHPAEGWLVAPDGQRCPVGWCCEELAREVIAEYDGSGYDDLKGWTFEDTRPAGWLRDGEEP